MKSLLCLSILFASSAFAGPMSNFCKARIYAKIDKALPANQYLTDITPGDRPGLMNVEISKDMGRFNMCIKTMTLEVKAPEQDLCDIGKLKAIPGNEFDCG